MHRLFTAQQEVVVAIEQQLAHIAKAVPLARRVTLTPEQIAIFMETTFWASLRTNEARAVRFSAAIASAASLRNSTVFAEPVPYDEDHIAKFALAQPPGGSLGISATQGPFEIWGFGQSHPWPGLVTVSVDVSEPGILRVNVGPYRPYAVLDGRSDPVLAQNEHALVFTLLNVLRKPGATTQVEQDADWREHQFLSALARAILADGHGGALLVVPSETGSWVTSLKFAHRLEHADSTIPDLVRHQIREETANAEASVHIAERTDVPEDIKTSIDAALRYRPVDPAAVVGPYVTMASVDGAVVVTKDMRILGFGAKITAESRSDDGVCIVRPLAGSQEVLRVPIAESGGTRHQSAVRFVRTHHDAVAIVVSQDRHLSIVYWDPDLSSVMLMRNAEWFA